ncbi:TRAP transporter substrate-binding protein DctP [Motiliproteus sp.]|uniref:TRAP transporter substrate-binding protein DctP n=1 Tax=Motiliproteus sp. TaxID=1898955 RepID=UPI003BA9B860
MDRRKFLKGAAATGVAAGTATMMSTSANAAKTVRLRMQRFYGTENEANMKRFAKLVKEASGGSLRITNFSGGELVPNDQMADAVGKGTLDMALGYGGYWPGQIDIATIESGLPGMWPNRDEADYLFHGMGLHDLVAEAYAEKGIRHMGISYGGGYDLLTKEPIKSLDDLKKMKIRATPAVAKTFKELGIPTVNLPAQELYVALSTGVIDGCIYGGTMEYRDLKLVEVAKHYTSLNMITPGWTDCILMNEKKWAKLSEEHKAILTMAVTQLAADQYNWFNNGNREAASEEGLFVFNTLSAEDSKRITAAAQDVWKAEADRSPRNAKAIELAVKMAKATGRL